MFRGNYARLTYNVATVHSKLFEGPDKILRKGEVVYVFIEEREGEVWHATRVQLEEPLSGLFLRGRLTQTWLHDEQPLRVRYGIRVWASDAPIGHAGWHNKSRLVRIEH